MEPPFRPATGAPEVATTRCCGSNERGAGGTLADATDAGRAGGADFGLKLKSAWKSLTALDVF
jgi:hypothetical protein